MLAALGERGEDVSARIVGVGDSIRARVDDLRAVIDGKGGDLLAALGERGEDVSARIVDASDSIKARVDDLRAVIDGKGADLLAALAEVADQSGRVIDSRLANMADAANRNAGSIDERLQARIQAMSDLLARTASEAELDLGGARSERRLRDQSEGR